MEQDSFRTKIDQIVDFILCVTNLLVIVCSIMGGFSYLMPSTLLSIVCSMMFAPLFVASIALLVVQFRKRRFVFATLNAICCAAIGSVILAFSPIAHFEDEQSSVDVLSYNVRSFNRYSKPHQSFLDIASWAVGHNFDIMALQEYSTASDDTFYKHFSRDYNIATALNGEPKRGFSDGLAIVTKYPILETQTLKDRDSVTFAICCDLRVETDTIRVIDVHLQSTHINQNIRGVASVGTNANRKTMRLLGDAKKSATSRYNQAERIAHVIERSPYRVLVCGDINDTPSSYTYKRLRGDLKDSFYEAGLGYTYTYFGYYRTQRIDNIFVSQDMEVSKYRSPNIKHSDHKPVVVQLAI